MSVYFVTAREVDLVKIGFSFNPVARFHHLRTSSPIDLVLEGAIPGGFEKERELHARYAKWRVRGEWFTITESIEDEIEASTKPTKYTWAAVRVWLKKLDDADKAIVQARVPPAVIKMVEKRIQVELNASAHRKSMTQLERLEAAGVIHFPFREREVA
jgi:hypothetical protein